jgi:hypothetical protein
MNERLPWPLVLDAYQLELIGAWQRRVEADEGPAVEVTALRGEQRVGAAAVLLDPPGARRVAAALAAVGAWVASRQAEAMLVVWHDAQLHGALECDCQWPGRLCALRVCPGGCCVDYYPAAIEGAGPLQTASWQTIGSTRDPQPTLPVVMLDLLAAWRTGGHSPWRRSGARRKLIGLGVELSTDLLSAIRMDAAPTPAAGR